MHAELSKLGRSVGAGGEGLVCGDHGYGRPGTPTGGAGGAHRAPLGLSVVGDGVAGGGGGGAESQARRGAGQLVWCGALGQERGKLMFPLKLVTSVLVAHSAWVWEKVRKVVVVTARREASRRSQGVG